MAKKRKGSNMSEIAHKKITGLFFGLFLIAFILVIIIVMGGNKPSTPEKTLTDQDLYDLAIAESDGSYCQDIGELELKGACLNLFVTKDRTPDDELVDTAVRQNNPDYCMQIGNESVKAACLNLFTEKTQPDIDYQELAIQTNDPTYCNNLEGTERQACLNIFGIQK